MKAIQYSSYAGLSELALVDVRKPSPGPGEVLVKVCAAGVNPVDIAVSEGFLKDFMPSGRPDRCRQAQGACESHLSAGASQGRAARNCIGQGTRKVGADHC